LKGRFFSVRNNNALSTKREINSGGPQGGVLSPTLFNINQIDMQYLPLNAKCMKYADDLLLYNSYKKVELQEGLGKLKDDLLKLKDYFIANGLSINFNKTSFMVMSNGVSELIPAEIQLSDNDKIDRVSEQKYLGVLLDDKLNFKPQHSLLINKLTDTLRALRIIKNHVPTETLIQFFNAHFMSHLYYCAYMQN